jgi:hypothetical protein
MFIYPSPFAGRVSHLARRALIPPSGTFSHLLRKQEKGIMIIPFARARQGMGEGARQGG